jgi:hypothetical protein
VRCEAREIRFPEMTTVGLEVAALTFMTVTRATWYRDIQIPKTFMETDMHH